jgi:hypothetical protein
VIAVRQGLRRRRDGLVFLVYLGGLFRAWISPRSRSLCPPWRARSFPERRRKIESISGPSRWGCRKLSGTIRSFFISNQVAWTPQIARSQVAWPFHYAAGAHNGEQDLQLQFVSVVDGQPRFLRMHAAGMRTDDPTLGVKRPKIKTDGHRTWSEDDIAAFEATHPIGTLPRLALALLLYTGQRRSDVVVMGRQHVRGDLISVRQQKTGTPLLIPLHPALRAAIEAVWPPDVSRHRVRQGAHGQRLRNMVSEGLKARLEAERRAAREATAAPEIVNRKIAITEKQLVAAIEARADEFVRPSLQALAEPLGVRYVKACNEIAEVMSLIWAAQPLIRGVEWNSGWHGFEKLDLPRCGLDSTKLVPVSRSDFRCGPRLLEECEKHFAPGPKGESIAAQGSVTKSRRGFSKSFSPRRNWTATWPSLLSRHRITWHLGDPQIVECHVMRARRSAGPRCWGWLPPRPQHPFSPTAAKPQT